MDPITHFTTGALSAPMLADRLTGWKAMAFCLAAAGLPDIDSLIGTGPEHYITYHRAFTHSIVGIIVLAAFLSGLFKIVWRAVAFKGLFFSALGIMSLQVYLDVATTFGTQILWPFSRHRFAFPGAFIIDPFFTLGLLGILVLILVLKGKRKSLGRLGLAVAVMYPLMNLGIGVALENRLAKRLPAAGGDFRSIHVTTDLLTPLYWKVITEDDRRYGLGSARLSLAATVPRVEVFQKPDPAQVKQLSEEASFFRTWFWFADYPVIWSVQENDGGSEVTFADLRFLSHSPLGRKIFPEYRPPFTLTARLDWDGRLAAYLFHQFGETADWRVPDRHRP
jgi:inner membrane protein